MKHKVHSEYEFFRKIETVGEPIEISLTVYINYSSCTYDIMQNNEEGIFPRNNDTNTEINKAYFELALEALEFIENELYKNKEK